MKLKEITIEITQQCPNYCIHCSSMSSLSKNHMMPLEKVKELIDDVDILDANRLAFLEENHSYTKTL
jgi:MoaA/NifB/PqqE/SkfB family radical SAM enzyme